VKEELVVRDLDLGLVREDNAVSTFFQCIFELLLVSSILCRSLRCSYQRDDLGWLRCQQMCQFLVEADQVVDIDITEVPLKKSVLS
jgi:hypothetical protein